MNIEDNTYTVDLDLKQEDIEDKYPLAIQIKENQNHFIETIKSNYLEDSEKLNITVKEKLEIGTAIDESVRLDVGSLYALADKSVHQNEDITKDQLTLVLLKSLASSKENKIMSKIAKRLIKKVGN